MTSGAAISAPVDRNAFGLAVSVLVDALRDEGMPSARNLLVTAFGDAFAPSDTAVPVQALVELLSIVGVNDRLVRTSLSRLVRDGILRNERVGRRSIYSIDPAARTLFEHADSRIYAHREVPWDGRWTLAVVDPTASTPTGRSVLRRELEWLGMGSIAPNVLAAPNLDPAAITSMLERIGGEHHVLVTRGAAATGASTMTDEEIARRCVPVEELSARYGQVVEWFAPLLAAFDATVAPTTEDCWAARLLLIATFRRVVLVDPALPRPMLPTAWNGDVARTLTASLYGRVRPLAERRLAEVFADSAIAWRPSGTPSNRFV